MAKNLFCTLYCSSNCRCCSNSNDDDDDDCVDDDDDFALSMNSSDNAVIFTFIPTL